MSLLSLLLDDPASHGPPDPQWRRNERGFYHRLAFLEPAKLGLKHQGGVFAIWHRGVHPEWVHVGAHDDLAFALEQARDSEEINRFEVNGGLYVTWSPIAPDVRAGVVAYLRQVLHPVAQARLIGEEIPHPDTDPVPVQPPS